MRRLAIDEDGAAYTLSYVMVIPVFALLMCMIIESVMMFTTKVGTVYTAFAAARTASVWSSATTWDKTLAKATSAAVKTMTPFASGTQGGREAAMSNEAIAFQNAFRAYAQTPISDKYLLSKFGYAKQHLKVDIAGPPPTSLDDITAKVTYEYPFAIPGIGRLFGHRGTDGRFYLTISSVATVPNEGPQDDRKTIGIGYGTFE
jgi:Flp pilus assembly protein TadG